MDESGDSLPPSEAVSPPDRDAVARVVRNLRAMYNNLINVIASDGETEASRQWVATKVSVEAKRREIQGGYLESHNAAIEQARIIKEEMESAGLSARDGGRMIAMERKVAKLSEFTQDDAAFINEFAGKIKNLKERLQTRDADYY